MVNYYIFGSLLRGKGIREVFLDELFFYLGSNSGVGFY